MANSRRLRRGVVKQLSNLSIDEVSLVDRGANQHALISIAKRAPEAGDYFDDVEKNVSDVFSVTAPFKARQGRKLAVTGRTVGRSVAEGYGGGLGGGAAGAGIGALATHSAEGAKIGGLIGGVAGQYAGSMHGSHAALHNAETRGDLNRAHPGVDKTPGVVHNHYYGVKAARAPEETLDVDALFGKKSSFGQGGQQDKVDEFSGDDPAGVLDDENGEDGDIGPGGKISGVETTEGEDTPPQKSKKQGKGDVNPSKLSGLGKSADFWRNVVDKVLDGEYATEDFGYDEDVDKHFPGGGGGGFQPQNPMQSPFPGAQGPGMAPTMQTPGVQPMGMGQPTPPPGGGMPQQLPPDVVQYIQQLEQALDQALGNDGGDGSEDNSSSDSSSSSSSSDDNKKNPFGKSRETSDMDETTFLTELAKSLDDDSEREAVEKALETVRKAEYRAQQAENIAKAERDLRLEREFVAKAAEFNLPVKAEDLGPVLKRTAERIDPEDFKTIVKCLRAVSAQEDYSNPFAEVGKRGGGDNADVLSQVDAAALELVGKSSGLSPEAATLQVLSENPRAYDEYMRDHPSRRNFK